MSEPNYLVVWHETNPTADPSESAAQDFWEVHPSLTSAKKRYDALRKLDSTWVAAICAVVEGTDYDAHPALAHERIHSSPKKRHKYHYCATHQPDESKTTVVHSDGVLACEKKILSYDDLTDIRNKIAEHAGCYPDVLSITSLTYLGDEA